MPQVRELMTESPRTVPPDASAVDAAKVMQNEDAGVVPIVEGDGRLIGVVTDRDIALRRIESRRSFAMKVVNARRMPPSKDSVEG